MPIDILFEIFGDGGRIWEIRGIKTQNKSKKRSNKEKWIKKANKGIK